MHKYILCTISMLCILVYGSAYSFFYLGENILEIDLELMNAVRANNIDGILQALNKGANINCLEGHGFPHWGASPLGVAVSRGQFDIAQLLISKGADVNEFLEHGLLFDNRNLNTRNIPILIFAIMKYARQDEHQKAVNLSIIDLLLHAKVNVNKRDLMDMWTPLMIASYYGLEDIVKKLLLAGADIHAQNPKDNNKTALDYAYEQRKSSVIKMFESL